MDTDQPSASEPPLAPVQPFASEPPPAPMQPFTSKPPPTPEQAPASVQPPTSNTLQQLVNDVHRISERQQLIINRLDTLSRDQQQLHFDFQTFQQQSIDQQLELITGHRSLLRCFGYNPGSTSSPPSQFLSLIFIHTFYIMFLCVLLFIFWYTLLLLYDFDDGLFL